MKSMKEIIESFIVEFRSKDTMYMNEISTKQTIVSKLLYYLGWDVFNEGEVVLEYSINVMRVDYLLKIGESKKVFIEVKKIGENLEIHQNQLLKYSFQDGIQLAILTNGIIWWFYLPLREGTWKQRRFYSIDILQQDPKDVAYKFVSFLSKENVYNGDAGKNAESIYEERQKSGILESTISKSWNKIITEVDSVLISLLSNTTENICGIKPDDDMVRQFLISRVNQLKLIDICPYVIESNSLYAIDENMDIAQSMENGIIPMQNNDGVEYVNYVGQYVSSFDFKGSNIKISTWKGLLVGILNILYSLHQEDFENKIRNVKLGRMTLHSYNPTELGTPYRVKDSKIYIETKFNANNAVRFCYNIILEFGYSYNDLKINLR